MHKKLALFITSGLVLLAACTASEAQGVLTGPVDDEDLTIVASNNAFSPDEIEADAGDEITFEVENVGSSHHELTFEGLDISTGDLARGDVVHGRLVVPPGTTRFYCRYHEGMDGTIEGER